MTKLNIDAAEEWELNDTERAVFERLKYLRDEGLLLRTLPVSFNLAPFFFVLLISRARVLILG